MLRARRCQVRVTKRPATASKCSETESAAGMTNRASRICSKTQCELLLAIRNVDTRKDRLLQRMRPPLAFQLARTGQNAGQGVIPLMAGILIQRLSRVVQRHLPAPRFLVELRIFHLEGGVDAASGKRRERRKKRGVFYPLGELRNEQIIINKKREREARENESIKGTVRV